MTSIRRKPTVLGSRRNTIEQEREQFQRSQEASFRKAINEEEVPVKMKHVRNLIIGTHTTRNGSAFWSLVALSPPLNTDVTAWKFCHTLHLILRDGHHNALKDSIQHINRLKNMGEHFRHLPAGYGALIQRYCALLICKLNFHLHYPRFPGTLQVTPAELESIAENDANNYFEMGVEMMEYMEKILKLYEAVFDSLDPSRANSMTKMGQCRLSPLIPSIQDSSSLYDFIVRILFKLHKMVPTDMLSGHRLRFNQQFKLLHAFYNNTRNLQYFKTLIQVPHLPQVAPNFLIEAELGSHVAPVVVVEEEVPDPSETPESLLVDTTEPSPPPVPPHPHPDVVNSHNGPMIEALAERESVIEALREELRECRNLIQTLRYDNSTMQEQHRQKIDSLEATIAELDSVLTAERKSKESVLAQVEAAAVSAEAVTKLCDEETRRRTAEEKFSKMKEVYQKLRDEHIALIRTKAEMEKVLSEERRSFQEEEDKRRSTEQALKRLEAELVQQNETQQSIEAANKTKECLEAAVAVLTKERDDATRDRDVLETSLREAEQAMTQQHNHLSDVISGLQSDLEKTRTESESLERSVADLRDCLEHQLEEISAECNCLSACLRKAEEEATALSDAKRASDVALAHAEALLQTRSEAHAEQVEDLKARLAQMETTSQEEKKKITSLNLSLSDCGDRLAQAQMELETTRTALSQTKEEKAKLIRICDAQESLIADLRRNVEGTLERGNQKVASVRSKMEEEVGWCVSSAVDSSASFIAFASSHFDLEAHKLIKATPEYTLTYRSPIEEAVAGLCSHYGGYVKDGSRADRLVGAVDEFGNFVATFLLYAKATSHASPNIDTAESLVSALEELAKGGRDLLQNIRSKSCELLDAESFLKDLGRCCDLVSSCEDLGPSREDVAASVEREMEAMNAAICEAVEKFSRMLQESRSKDSGMQLEVNEGILGTCSELMSAVRLLVQRASELQTEVVAAGKMRASPREFYKRNHRWTEGLLSGAKAVGIACQALVEAADKVVCKRGGKFEEVMVASKEIAASSMQLVMASRVKAGKESLRLANLNAAAKTISTLTGTVVATAESCRDKVSATNLDFSKLSLHSAKLLEMETLVKVLETEKKLEVERAKLSELRRHHYQLAGELEGWDPEDLPK